MVSIIVNRRYDIISKDICPSSAECGKDIYIYIYIYVLQERNFLDKQLFTIKTNKRLIVIVLQFVQVIFLTSLDVMSMLTSYVL